MLIILRILNKSSSTKNKSYVGISDINITIIINIINIVIGNKEKYSKECSNKI